MPIYIVFIRCYFTKLNNQEIVNVPASVISSHGQPRREFTKTHDCYQLNQLILYRLFLILILYRMLLFDNLAARPVPGELLLKGPQAFPSSRLSASSSCGSDGQHIYAALNKVVGAVSETQGMAVLGSHSAAEL